MQIIRLMMLLRGLNQELRLVYQKYTKYMVELLQKLDTGNYSFIVIIFTLALFCNTMWSFQFFHLIIYLLPR